MAEVKRQLQKALLTKEEGGKDESGFLNGLLRNIVNNLEITLLRVHFLFAFSLTSFNRFTFDMKTTCLTLPSSALAPLLNH